MFVYQKNGLAAIVRRFSHVLIDSVVGRMAIDALEPFITCDDNNQTFCGRSHANTNRKPGDYEKWFSVWQDYTSAIAQAAESRGYAYVFDTDVSDFGQVLFLVETGKAPGSGFMLREPSA